MKKTISTKNKFIISIIFIAAVIFSVVIVFILNDNTKNKCDNQIFFMKNSSFLTYSINDSDTISFVYFSDRNKIDMIEENITSVEFGNSNLLEVESHDIKKGSTSKNYDIKTLSVSIKAINKGKEIIDFIRIHFDNGQELKYYIGSWNISIDDSLIGNHLTLKDKYPAMTGSFKDINFTFRNTSSENLTVQSIIFQPIVKDNHKETLTIKPNTNQQCDIYVDRNYYINDYAVIKPKVIYSVSGEQYSYYLPKIHFGYLHVTDELIEKQK